MVGMCRTVAIAAQSLPQLGRRRAVRFRSCGSSEADVSVSVSVSADRDSPAAVAAPVVPGGPRRRGAPAELAADICNLY